MVINRSFKLNIVITVMLAVMIFLPMDLNASQDDTKYSAGHFYYHSYPGYVSICGYIGDETDISIPSSISGKPVSVIESGAFDGCDSIKTIEVPDTVIKVADDSFTGAGSLEKIVSHTVDVPINVNVGVSVDYTAQKEATAVVDDQDLNISDEKSVDSKKSEADINMRDNDSKQKESDLAEQVADANTADKNQYNKIQSSDSLSLSDIGDGGFLEIDERSGVKNDSDQTKQNSFNNSVNREQTEEINDDMIVKSNDDQRLEIGKEETNQMGLSTDIKNNGYLGNVILCFVAMTVIVGICVFCVNKRKK